MPPPLRAFLLGLASLLLCLLALQREAPLFVNLGAGDGRFARGFRGGWERDGLNQSGETMFRWTQDGSRLELPLAVRSGHLQVQLRLARFAPGDAEISVSSAGHVVDHWTQPSTGWQLRTLDLGELRGPLGLVFRSTSPDPDGLGLALDWVRVQGAGGVLPLPGVWFGLACLLVGVPLLLARTFPGYGLLALALAPAAVGCDRLGGLLALSDAGPPALVAVALLLGLRRALHRLWPDDANLGALAIPAAVLVLALVALCQPFFYYPDIDTHARYLAALRLDPGLALDPTPYQLRVSAWTREIAGHRIAFPYSPVFHLLSWPFALCFGEERAIKTVACLAVALTLLLTHAFARRLAFDDAGARTAQALLALLPVIASRLTLALYPALLGQALELWLLVVLCRRPGPRTAFGLILLVSLAYTGSLFSVGILVALVTLLEFTRGERRAALSLALAYGLATALVVLALYARFVPTLLRDVLPHARGGAEAAFLAPALARLLLFYGWVHLLLLAPGLRALRDAPLRGFLVCALSAGGLLLLLRYLAPFVFRDAKEIELLAAPVAIVSAAALGAGWRRGGLWRIAAVAAAVWLCGWGASSATSDYRERFLAIDLD